MGTPTDHWNKIRVICMYMVNKFWTNGWEYLEQIVYSINGAEQVDRHTRKSEPQPYFIAYTKINSGHHRYKYKTIKKLVET